jgi:hypothetical protein
MPAILPPPNPVQGQTWYAPNGIAYKYRGNRWSPVNFPITANPKVTSLTSDGDLQLSNESRILLNQDAGWRDLFGSIELRGNTGPSWLIWRNGVYAYAFPRNQSREAFVNFHLNHDYALGTKIFPHLHIGINVNNVSGRVRFGIEYLVAKGHGEGVFLPANTVYVERDLVGSTDEFRHIVMEVSEEDAIPPDQLEADSMVLVRVFRDTNVANNIAADVFCFACDLHYQANRFATINKVPNFYGEH